jgi:integrase
MNDVSDTLGIEPYHLRDYRKQRDANVATTTVKTHMDTVRVFIRNLEKINAVPEGTHEFAESPSLTDGEGQRSDYLSVDRGDHILEYVRKYRYGSYEHVYYELLWAVGLRIGSIYSIDVDDVDVDDRAVKIRHRPKQGTTLKNKSDGERDISLVETTIRAIEAYLDSPDRPDTTDEYGREPLLASPDGGRFSKSHLRNVCYWLTTPCVTGGECLYDADDGEECLYARNMNKSTLCPESKSPHALRSGALTRQLKEKINPQLISQRANVSVERLYEHYAEMDKRERMNVRREWFDDEFSGRAAEEAVFGDDIVEH